MMGRSDWTRCVSYLTTSGSYRTRGWPLHIRLRKGSANTQKGIKRFCEELIARVGRAGATAPKLLRADSGF
jgi:hypothetical protein